MARGPQANIDGDKMLIYCMLRVADHDMRDGWIEGFVKYLDVYLSVMYGVESKTSKQYLCVLIRIT